jgi:hypothetical protein
MDVTHDCELAAIAAREPWRQRVGYPNTVDDPLWSPEEHEECDGELEQEEGAKYWCCSKCGYIGWSTSGKHYPILHPREFFEWCREFFLMSRREDTELTEEEISDQMLFLMGVVLKHASTKKPEEIRDFVERIAAL